MRLIPDLFRDSILVAVRLAFIRSGIVVLSAPACAEPFLGLDNRNHGLLGILFVIKNQKDHEYHDKDKDEAVKDVQGLQCVHNFFLYL